MRADFGKARFGARVLALAAATSALAGCISLTPKPPASLLSLNAAGAGVQPGSERRGAVNAALTILVPTVPQKLRTQRVPVTTAGTQIAYVKDAQWVEAPARLFQRLLSETVAARGSRLVLDESQYVAGPGELLAGQLMEFGVDADRMEAVVTYQAQRLSDAGAQVVQRRFEARVPITAVEPVGVGQALNDAANRVAADVAGWVG